MASTLATVSRSVSRCGDKHRFTTFASARRIAKWTHLTTDDPTRAYACGVCGGYHVGKLEEGSREKRLATARTRRYAPTVSEQVTDLGLNVQTVYRYE